MFKTMFGISYEQFKALAALCTVGYSMALLSKDNDNVRDFINKHAIAIVIAIGVIFTVIMYMI